MSVVTVAEVKLRLNKSLTVDDAEIQSMIDAAEGYYSEVVGAIGSSTFRYDGTRPVILPRSTTVTAVAYLDGTPIPLADLYHNKNSGVLGWTPYRSSTPTYMVWGGALSEIDVTFTAALPVHHREAIIADVAGYFAATQRGNSGGALPTGYETAYEDRTTPVVLFPRIKALAESYAGIG